jgi:hypothetical protein
VIFEISDKKGVNALELLCFAQVSELVHSADFFRTHAKTTEPLVASFFVSSEKTKHKGEDAP